MGMKSDLAVLFSFENNESNIIDFKSKMNETILKNIDDENFNYLISNFYKTITINKSIEFLFMDECIKSEFVPTSEFFEILDSLKFVKYECIDLSSEAHLEYSCKTNITDSNTSLYAVVTIGGLPEVGDESLLDFIKM